MEEDPDVLAIARAMIQRFGAEAVAVGEERAEMHRRAQESAGAELWQRVADAAQTILSGHSGRVSAPSFPTVSAHPT